MEATERIGIYGVGGHGKVVAQIARSTGFSDIIWIDDAAEEALTFKQFLQRYPQTPAALGIGTNAAREAVFAKMEAAGLTPMTLVDPSAIVAEDAVLGAGCVVMPKAVINTEARIGKGAIVNTAAVIEHECRLDNFVHVSPAAALAGAVEVGTRTHIGIGSSVIQCLHIGADCIVAAGAAVTADLPDSVLAAGVPACIKKELK